MSEEELKRCPFCDEPIRVKAVICKHCHQWLPGYSYESAIRDLVIQKQTSQPQLVDTPEVLTREQRYDIARNWAKRGKGKTEYAKCP